MELRNKITGEIFEGHFDGHKYISDIDARQYEPHEVEELVSENVLVPKDVFEKLVTVSYKANIVLTVHLVAKIFSTSLSEANCYLRKLSSK